MFVFLIFDVSLGYVGIMAYVNVAEWKPDQVTDWLKGKKQLHIVFSIITRPIIIDQLKK